MNRAPLPRPLSVVVFGNSVAVLQVPPRAPHDPGTYGEVLVDRLHESGVPANLHLEGRWFDFVSRGMRRYEPSLRAHAPDVVVLQYGLNESQPWLTPIWLVRHLMTRHRASTRLARWYRRTITPHLWNAVKSFRRAVAGPAGTRTWQMTPRRFRHLMRHLIRSIRIEQRPLVLVLDLNPPVGALARYLPGMQERHAVYQRTLARIVTEADDPDVRLVRVSEVAEVLGGDAALPDGMHYSAAAHRWVGERLAEEVLAWHEARSGSGDGPGPAPVSG